MNTQNLKAGTSVTVTFVRPEGDHAESATIRRPTAAMLPLPAGYVPVRFANGSTALVSAALVSL